MEHLPHEFAKIISNTFRQYPENELPRETQKKAFLFTLLQELIKTGTYNDTDYKAIALKDIENDTFENSVKVALQLYQGTQPSGMNNEYDWFNFLVLHKN